MNFGTVRLVIRAEMKIAHGVKNKPWDVVGIPGDEKGTMTELESLSVIGGE